MAVLLVFTINSNIYAGNINGNEASVVGVINGTFSHDGVTYRAKQEYINRAMAYLQQDGVDLTAEQASQAVSTIYANVVTGIQSGYIYPIEPQGATQNKETTTKKKTEKETTTKKENENETNTKNDTTTKPTTKEETIIEESSSTMQKRTVEENRWYEDTRIWIVLISVVTISTVMLFVVTRKNRSKESK